MSLEKLLQFTNSKRPPVSPVEKRRSRLIQKIDHQLAILSAPEQFSPRTVGQTWWWKDDTGAYCLEVRYGRKVIEFGKGKTTIRCKDADALRTTLDAVRQAVVSGELDQTLERLATEIRAGFGRS